MLYCEKIENHKIGDNTPFEKVAEKLGWTIKISEENTEVAYDGSLWEKGYAPKESVEQKNEKIRQQRQERYIAESDPIRLDYDEALAREQDNAEQLKQEWLASKDKIREELPHIVGE